MCRFAVSTGSPSSVTSQYVRCLEGGVEKALEIQLLAAKKEKT